MTSPNETELAEKAHTPGPRDIRFGKKTYRIKFARWDSWRHVGLIQVYDENENGFVVESDGLAPWEQRQAVASWACQRAAIAKATAAMGGAQFIAPNGDRGKLEDQGYDWQSQLRTAGFLVYQAV